MLAALIIVFREVFEAGLIVGIVLAVTGSVRHRNRWIGGGVLAGAARRVDPCVRNGGAPLRAFPNQANVTGRGTSKLAVGTRAPVSFRRLWRSFLVRGRLPGGVWPRVRRGAGTSGPRWE